MMGNRRLSVLLLASGIKPTLLQELLLFRWSHTNPIHIELHAHTHIYKVTKHIPVHTLLACVCVCLCVCVNVWRSNMCVCALPVCICAHEWLLRVHTHAANANRHMHPVCLHETPVPGDIYASLPVCMCGICLCIRTFPDCVNVATLLAYTHASPLSTCASSACYSPPLHLHIHAPMLAHMLTSCLYMDALPKF